MLGRRLLVLIKFSIEENRYILSLVLERNRNDNMCTTVVSEAPEIALRDVVTVSTFKW